MSSLYTVPCTPYDVVVVETEEQQTKIRRSDNHGGNCTDFVNIKLKNSEKNKWKNKGRRDMIIMVRKYCGK